MFCPHEENCYLTSGISPSHCIVVQKIESLRLWGKTYKSLSLKNVRVRFIKQVFGSYTS